MEIVNSLSTRGSRSILQNLDQPLRFIKQSNEKTNIPSSQWTEFPWNNIIKGMFPQPHNYLMHIGEIPTDIRVITLKSQEDFWEFDPSTIEGAG